MDLRRRAPWIVGFGAALLAGCAAPDPPEPASWTVTVLAQGSPLHATNGMYFGPDGRLYVVSASSAIVAAIDKESGELLERWGPELGVQGPTTSRSGRTARPTGPSSPSATSPGARRTGRSP